MPSPSALYHAASIKQELDETGVAYAEPGAAPSQQEIKTKSERMKAFFAKEQAR